MKPIIQFILVCLLSEGIIAQPSINVNKIADNWTRIPDFGGTPRTYACGFSISGKIYVGLGSGVDLLKDFWEYDPLTFIWTRKADFAGNGSEGAASFAIGNKGYVGMGDQTKDFWEYDPATDKWTRKADFAGDARWFPVSFSVGNKGYVGMGNGAGFYKDFWEYDPATDVWTRKKDFAGGKRTEGVGFSIGSKGYVSTGAPGDGTFKNDLWQYNPVTDGWARKADFGGEARAGAAGFSIGSKGYIGTGYSYSGFLKDFWEYDPATDTWTRKADYGGRERQYASVVSTSTAGYVGTGGSYGPVADFWAYGLDSIVPGVPNIVSFVPASGPVGTEVKITGNDFGATPAQNIVFFGAVRAIVTAASTTSLTVAVPAGATYKLITVTTNGLTAFSIQPFTTTFNGGGLAFDSTSFAPKTDFLGGDPYGSRGICTVDLDGDGKSELVVVDNKVNYDGNSISVLRNISSPGITAFAPKVDFITGLSPQSVTFGDVDGDGKPDLLVANYFDHSISVLRNSSTIGSIAFDPKADFDIGYGYGWQVAINDIDGDGKPDIAVAKGNALSIMRNTSTAGTISFGLRIDYVITVSAAKVALRDMDGDDKPDIVAVNGRITTLRNMSFPGIIVFDSPVYFPANGYSFDIGDLNGDGKPDIVLQNATLKNNSTPGNILLAAPQSFESLTEPYDVTVGDLNGDGKPDIAVAGPNENTFAVIRNISEDTAILFAPKVGYKTTGFTWGIAMADLDGDGKTDMTADYDFGSPIPYAVSVFRNRMADNSCPLVTGLSAVNITDISAMARWAMPGAAVSSFKIRYRQVGTIPVFRKQVKGTRNNVKLDSLLPNTTYEWQIRSNCIGDTSGWVIGPDFTTSLTFASDSGYAISDAKVTDKTSFQITPNPNKGNFSVQMQLPAKVASTTILLYNSFGQIVWQHNLGNIGGTVQRTIALENKLSAGLYTLTIQRSDIKLNQRMLINK